MTPNVTNKSCVAYFKDDKYTFWSHSDFCGTLDTLGSLGVSTSQLNKSKNFVNKSCYECFTDVLTVVIENLHNGVHTEIDPIQGWAYTLTAIKVN